MALTSDHEQLPTRSRFVLKKLLTAHRNLYAKQPKLSIRKNSRIVWSSNGVYSLCGEEGTGANVVYRKVRHNYLDTEALEGLPEEGGGSSTYPVSIARWFMPKHSVPQRSHTVTTRPIQCFGKVCCLRPVDTTRLGQGAYRAGLQTGLANGLWGGSLGG